MIGGKGISSGSLRRRGLCTHRETALNTQSTCFFGRLTRLSRIDVTFPSQSAPCLVNYFRLGHWALVRGCPRLMGQRGSGGVRKEDLLS